jgi:hypothetical protein
MSLRGKVLAGLLVVLVASIMAFVGFIFWIGDGLFGPDPCRNWRPGMTHQEKILMVLDNTNRLNSLVFEITRPETGDIYADLIPQVPYESAEIILKEQPDCCHVYSQHTALTDHPKLVDKTSKGDEGVVVLRYIGKYRESPKAQSHAAPISRYLNLNNCKR